MVIIIIIINSNNNKQLRFPRRRYKAAPEYQYVPPYAEQQYVDYPVQYIEVEDETSTMTSGTEARFGGLILEL